jgi:hypothetical protein
VGSLSGEGLIRNKSQPRAFPRHLLLKRRQVVKAFVYSATWLQCIRRIALIADCSLKGIRDVRDRYKEIDYLSGDMQGNMYPVAVTMPTGLRLCIIAYIHMMLQVIV